METPLYTYADEDGEVKGHVTDPAKRFLKGNIKQVRLTQAEHAWLQTVKTVRFGFINGLPPFTFIENGEYKGLHTDYLGLIGKRTGIRFEYVPVTANEVDLKAKKRELDMFPTLTIPERKEYANFTIPLMEYKFGIITRNDIPFISDISMLNGEKIAVIKGIKFYKHLFEAYPEIEWVERKNMLEALKAVSKSEADGYVGSSLITSWLIQKHHLVNLRVTGMLDSISDQLMYAVRNDCPELLGIINKGVASITKEEHDAILRKWFKVTIEYAPNWSEYTEWFIWIAGIIFAIVSITLYWNTRMGIEVSERKKTEELLRESNAKNKAILSAIPDMIVIQNREGVFLEWHASSESNFYVPPSEFIGKTPAQVLPKELADLNLNSGRKVFRTGKECIVEYPLQIGDRLQFYESRMVSCTPETVLCIIRNITARKHAEEALRESRELYRKLVENINDVLYTMDADGIFRYISPVLEPKFGFSPKEVVGKKFAEFIHPEDLLLAFDQFQKLLSGKEVTCQYRVFHKSGEIRWIRTSSQPTFTGDALTIQGVITDITAPKIAEDKIRKLLNEQKIILDNAMVGIVFVKERKIVRVNKFVEKFSGLSMKELSGQSTEIMYPSKESYEELGGKAYPVLSRGEVFETDWILRRKDNPPFWCNIVGAVINPGNPDEGSIWILQDIDKKKQFEVELRKAKEAAESANIAKSTFLANMSHELRTPLNSIFGYAQILKNDCGLTADQRKGLKIIEQSGNHLLSLLNDILDIAKIESGKVALYETDFHFLDFIRNVCDLIKVRAKQKGLRFHPLAKKQARDWAPIRLN